MGFKQLLQLANFTLELDATLNTKIHKNSVCIKAPNLVKASKRKHRNQINHKDKQRRILMANSTVCQIKGKPVMEPRRAKPKAYRQAPTHWDHRLRTASRINHREMGVGLKHFYSRPTSPCVPMLLLLQKYIKFGSHEKLQSQSMHQSENLKVKLITLINKEEDSR